MRPITPLGQAAHRTDLWARAYVAALTVKSPAEGVQHAIDEYAETTRDRLIESIEELVVAAGGKNASNKPPEPPKKVPQIKAAEGIARDAANMRALASCGGQTAGRVLAERMWSWAGAL